MESLPGTTSDVMRWVGAYAPLIGLIVALVIAVALVLLLIELRRLRDDVFTYDNSIHTRLRAIQDAVERQGPARYGLAAYIAASRQQDRTIENIRDELEAIIAEWNELETTVEDVLRALGDVEQRMDRGDVPRQS